MDNCDGNIGGPTGTLVIQVQQRRLSISITGALLTIRACLLLLPMKPPFRLILFFLGIPSSFSAVFAGVHESVSNRRTKVDTRVDIISVSMVDQEMDGT